MTFPALFSILLLLFTFRNPTRQNRAGTRVYLPEQALTVEQAVRLFTSDAAWASRDEAVRGTLELMEDEEHGQEALIRDLPCFDRESAARIHPNHVPRAVRPFEIYRTTGVTMTL